MLYWLLWVLSLVYSFVVVEFGVVYTAISRLQLSLLTQTSQWAKKVLQIRLPITRLRSNDGVPFFGRLFFLLRLTGQLNCCWPVREVVDHTRLFTDMDDDRW